MAFNQAPLAKQGWHELTNLESLCVLVLCGRYYKNSNFLQTRATRVSFIWWSIIFRLEQLRGSRTARIFGHHHGKCPIIKGHMHHTCKGETFTCHFRGGYTSSLLPCVHLGLSLVSCKLRRSSITRKCLHHLREKAWKQQQKKHKTNVKMSLELCSRIVQPRVNNEARSPRTMYWAIKDLSAPRTKSLWTTHQTIWDMSGLQPPCYL